MHDGADDVEDIAQQPHNDELDREGIGAAALKVLDNLRREDDNWQPRVSIIIQQAASMAKKKLIGVGYLLQQAIEMDLGHGDSSRQQKRTHCRVLMTK